MNLLEYTARTDYLTGIGNRRSLDKVLAAAMSSAARRQRPFSLAMIDLDWFKRYNDDFGHQKGDLYLRDAAAKWRGVLRPEDSISRYGGEEFVVLLADTAREGAMSCLERLRLATPAPLTCSIGVAQWNGSESGGALIDRADQAVYQAKAGGRNRLVFNPERNFAEAPRTPVLVC
jgi:diguanylate cyclase (GGDEF)-like protein